MTPPNEITLLKDKRIVLGVTGSIAAYKVADLASKLTQAGALVDVIMTQVAQQFITPLTFQAVTGRPVYTDLWKTEQGGLPTHIAHIGLAEGADVLAMIPATANSIAKLAGGFAEDLLSITALAARCPVIVAPAMDGGMYAHPATQANLATLRGRGLRVLEPEVGRMASGLSGIGRLPEVPTLFGQIRLALAAQGALAGRKVVVTAGGTREAIDPVRFITNRSSGKQGYALAQAALDAGATVTLISTTREWPNPVGATMVQVSSAAELLDAVLKHSNGADALIMAAAVADFRPRDVATHKIKKTDNPDDVPTIVLTRTADILLKVAEARRESGSPRIAVGFAAESRDLLDNARAKLERKGLDMLVANDISAADAGFEVDTNRVTILDAGGGTETLELASKSHVAEHIIQRISQL